MLHHRVVWWGMAKDKPVKKSKGVTHKMRDGTVMAGAKHRVAKKSKY